MNETNKFIEIMNQKTDDELVDIINIRNQYQPDAANAVLIVSLQRNLITQEQYDEFVKYPYKVFVNEKYLNNLKNVKKDRVRQYRIKRSRYTITSMGIVGIISILLLGSYGFIGVLIGAGIGRLVFELSNEHPFPDG